ncbi:pyridoxal-phosphate dependent enzyme [Amycolatopsis sp. K13G38]|uniref:Pyridoxal-phosphate dependent enzyme n=1 Tax=Amycolatopsis acididurans TaxID=2724524 RepID=A0ABX1J4T9_9PSEU|nr:pyridoxal-phosphate dependent enzyme [Amycolatopsis acididurans]NKQ53330.1 pyridoxal-phosphate dependent enzyme [Amycolatopsis acididurans]
MNLDDIRAAAGRIAGHAYRTPILTSRTLDERVGARVLLKCENFQRIGAFKFRGAYNALAQLSAEQLARGVAAYSSGNHAQAVALAAALLGTKATILMPADTPQSKKDAVLGYGGRIVEYDRYTQDRVALGTELAEREGRVLIPPYDHPHIIAGQGTAALEFLEETGALDALIVPLGGGGLIAGSALAATSLMPGIEIVGVEPEAGDDHRRSFEAGERVSIEVPRTIADGLMSAVPGELTFPINRKLVSSVATVTDDEIRDAMRFLFERLKIVVEPSGAVGVAALLSGKVLLPGKEIGVLISGGNISAERFAQLVL